MITFDTNKLAIGSALAAQVFCLWILHTVQRLAGQAYQTVIPGLSLPRFTELAMHTTVIFAVFGAAILILIGLVTLRRTSPAVKTCSVAILISVEMILVAALCWAYLLPFGYMVVSRCPPSLRR